LSILNCGHPGGGAARGRRGLSGLAAILAARREGRRGGSVNGHRVSGPVCRYRSYAGRVNGDDPLRPPIAPKEHHDHSGGSDDEQGRSVFLTAADPGSGAAVVRTCAIRGEAGQEKAPAAPGSSDAAGMGRGAPRGCRDFSGRRGPASCRVACERWWRGGWRGAWRAGGRGGARVAGRGVPGGGAGRSRRDGGSVPGAR
jgi:hypothetical protein